MYGEADIAALLTTLTGLRVDAQLTQIAGATCESPPPLHCPNVNCPRELIAHHGNALPLAESISVDEFCAADLLSLFYANVPKESSAPFQAWDTSDPESAPPEHGVYPPNVKHAPAGQNHA